MFGGWRKKKQGNTATLSVHKNGPRGERNIPRGTGTTEIAKPNLNTTNYFTGNPETLDDRSRHHHWGWADYVISPHCGIQQGLCLCRASEPRKIAAALG